MWEGEEGAAMIECVKKVIRGEEVNVRIWNE